MTILSSQNKWVELFPTVVSMAKTMEVISTGMMGSHSGSLQLVTKNKFHHLDVFFSQKKKRILLCRKNFSQ